MESLDLNSLLQESLSTANSLGNLATSGIPQIIQQGNEINAQRQQLAKDAADAAQIKTSVEFSEVARQEATRKAIAARLGTDASQTGWIIGQQFDAVRQADQIMAQEGEQIRAKRSVNFLTNPLGWLAGQLTIGENIANYNAAADQKDRAVETARVAEQMSQQSFQTNNVLSATATEAYSNAMKVLGSYQYSQNAMEAAMQGARWNMEGVMHASNASRERLTVLYSANSAIMQEKQYQTELARLRLSTASFNLQKEAHDEKMHEDALILKYVSDGYFNMTGKQIDKTTAQQALILFKSKHPDIMDMFDSGLASSKIVGGQGSKPVISLSPAKAADLYGTGKVTNMSPAMNQVGDQLVTWRRQFENPAVQTQYPFDAKDKKSKEVAFNKYVDDQKKIALSNVQQGSVFAPFDISKVAAVNKNIANLPVYKNVIAPAIQTGVDVNDPNVVFGLVSAAMREGKLSYPDAADISLMYAAGLDMNNQLRNFIAFGISPVKSYNVAISVPGTFGKTTVNLADQKTLATALNKAEAINAYYRMSSPENQPVAGTTSRKQFTQQLQQPAQ